MIPDGYYIKARCIQESFISKCPPYVREIWDWLLKEANHKDVKYSGITIKRGQLLRTFLDIQNGLSWMVGWRKMTYKKWHCEKAMKILRTHGMIATMKTTRGMLITVCNYCYYQDSKNYESNRKTDTKAGTSKQTTDTINKNDKNDKKKREISSFFKKESVGGKKMINEDVELAKIRKRLALFSEKDQETIQSIKTQKKMKRVLSTLPEYVLWSISVEEFENSVGGKK